MDEMIRMLDEKVWAVVGATDNKEKFGYKIFKYLQNYGYKVYPVNPGVTEIDGHKCYASLKALPEKPGAVNVVVSPKIGQLIMHDCAELGIKKVWLQPGADGDAVIATANQLGLAVIHHACVMVELRKKGGVS
ncbi:MAG: CoA-binding protein [Veillonellaceae bacterium]|jgi:predicted CoA-binding protein|nr:CoA-binding protein [Veillonellaceae bacterium]